jgi:energy-coupling factor transporter ATP-binding protein EcfA2
MSEKLLILLTGPTGVGKSTAAETIATICNGHGLRSKFISDYPILETWARDNRGDLARVMWDKPQDSDTEYFSVLPNAYQEASTFIASSIAHEILTTLDSFDIFTTEAARGAGSPPDTYIDHLYKPLINTLNGLVKFANIQVVVNNVNELRQRVKQRFEVDPTAAPPFVLERYISDSGTIQSSVEQAQIFPSHFVYNGEVNNSRNPKDTRNHIATIINSIILGDIPG